MAVTLDLLFRLESGMREHDLGRRTSVKEFDRYKGCAVALLVLPRP